MLPEWKSHKPEAAIPANADDRGKLAAAVSTAAKTYKPPPSLAVPSIDDIGPDVPRNLHERLALVARLQLGEYLQEAGVRRGVAVLGGCCFSGALRACLRTGSTAASQRATAGVPASSARTTGWLCWQSRHCGGGSVPAEGWLRCCQRLGSRAWPAEPRRWLMSPCSGAPQVKPTVIEFTTTDVTAALSVAGVVVTEKGKRTVRRRWGAGQQVSIASSSCFFRDVVELSGGALSRCVSPALAPHARRPSRITFAPAAAPPGGRVPGGVRDGAPDDVVAAGGPALPLGRGVGAQGQLGAAAPRLEDAARHHRWGPSPVFE